jgi:hypothetical protein
VHGTLGTSGRPLYFLHVPKTAGSAFTRMLDDAFPVGTRVPGEYFAALGGTPLAEALRGHGLLAGHFGLLPLALGPLTTVTVLREPAARAWSHVKYMTEHGRKHTLESFLADPVEGLGARDYQARWLGTPNAERTPDGTPAGAYLPTTAGGGHDAPPAAALERAAATTLAGCALVGTAERLPETIDALGRLIGRPLALPPRVNVTRDASPLPPEAAARIRALSPIDLRLHAEAGRRLDRALATLPPLPPEALVPLPYAQGMDAGLHGTGFHRRTHAPGAGWHRWTGPGRRSAIRLPVRLAGPATLTLAVVSACDDDAVRSLRLEVQGAPVAHRLASPPDGPGVLVVAGVGLDPGRPLTVELEIAHTRHLVDPATGAQSPDAAGLALGTLGFR